MNWIASLKDFGIAGMMLFVAWKIADKWLALFLTERQAQTKALMEQTAAVAKQATAVTQLATVVSESQRDQHEVLLAVRVQSREMGEMKELLQGIASMVGREVKA